MHTYWEKPCQRNTDNSTNYYDTPKYVVHVLRGAVSKTYRRLPETRNYLHRDGGGDGREDEYGDEHEGRDRGKNGSGSGSGNGDENRDEGGGEREPENLRSGYRGGLLEDARRRATPTSNQQSQPQDPTPQRDCCIMLRTRPEPRDWRRGTGSRRTETGRRSVGKPREVVDAMWERGETWAKREKKT